MKHSFSILVALALITGFTSCQKVIDVDVDEAEKKIVIDAVLSDEAGGCIVKVSKTKNINDDNAFNGVAGAVITIKDEAGTVSSLTEESAGIYKNSTLVAEPGKKYELTVLVEGHTFTSTSVTPQPIPLDSIYIKKQKFFDEDEIFACVVFQDPAGKRNYYRMIQTVNNKRTDGNFIMDDELSDGKKFNSTLYFFADDEEKMKPGDNVIVEMQCINADVYKYWFSLDQSATGSSQSAAPANPVSNISGGALGYFSTHTVSRKSVVVP